MGNSASLDQHSSDSFSLSSYYVYQNPNFPTPLPNPNLNQLSLSSSPDSVILSSSPDSVINNWELIEVVDDFDFDIVQYPNHHSTFLEKPNSYCNGLIKKIDDDSGAELLDSYELVEHCESNHKSEESLLSFGQALTSCPSQPNCSKVSSFNAISDNNNNNNIVLYYTSMRGIRRTYEDCCRVRTILKLSGVLVDERDVSMDSKYRKELQNVFEGKRFTLPVVFIRGKCLGGADEIKQLDEDGELASLLEGFPVKDPVFVCHSCGDARFVICSICNGRRKYFQEGEMKTCSNCNENGLVHCPGCCS